ncbi:probable C-mannosyltransferase DPY19L3 [Orbicella faveolata]|uniref:probable C-mannosyltransferase DPY19L3 n=1 Tax=Orbicella faveolata TaxID=48498 RepID=UPI0009E190E1|nr:probable C-mannosyltransferase DPY19L3 [Orbicella faveolata]
MSELRRRRGGQGKDKNRHSFHSNGSTKGQQTEHTKEGGVHWFSLANFLVGATVALIVGVKYALYVRELHENDMWFSNIGQIEREISFRTESGLYFSYYKQIVLAPSLFQGIYDVMHDNRTEHLRTINILERFNIYQEVILAALYRILPIQESVEYVYFYIDTVFGLHGMYMVSLFASSWILSGSWLAGLLSACLYIFNKDDTTRISFTIPLRESFGFPFLFAQIAFITFFFKKNVSSLAQVHFVVIVFIISLGRHGGLMVNALARSLYLIVIGSLIGVCILQFVNDMILCSLALSFAVASVALMTFHGDRKTKDSFLVRVFKLGLNVIAVLLLAGGISFLIKVLMRIESDEHIFKFLKAKFGYGIGRDFDSLLYLCEGAFKFLPTDVYGRLTTGVVFPCYVVSLVAVLTLLAYTVFANWRKNEETTEEATPLFLNSHAEVVYQAIQSVFFGVLAMSTLRFKFLWTPHMCLFAAGVFCNQSFWKAVLNKIGIKQIYAKIMGHAVPAMLLGLLLFNRLPKALKDLEELREFYDPDTVELMTWINENTSPDASFTGSMQLLAGVKLCTDRHTTNHPHYENKFLRERTKQVYQIYAHQDTEMFQTLSSRGNATKRSSVASAITNTD